MNCSSRLIHNFPFLTLLLIVFASPAKAQSLFYNSGEIYIDSGVIVHVNGAFENDEMIHPAQTNTLLENNGEITTATNIKAGNFIIRNNATVRGGGTYRVEQNWINHSPNFIANKSQVILFGDQEQLITGSELTYFSQLELRGDGLTGTDRVKRMTLNARVKDTLRLNDRELAADSFALIVENSHPTAITHNDTVGKEGFVSTLLGTTQSGYLSRRTSNSAEVYLFPVGSSINPPSGREYVYRPVELTPSSASTNTFQVRFTYNDPTLDGYDVLKFDSTICTVNDQYYHIINHPVGFDSAHTSIVYDPVTDGIFDRIARWGQFGDSLWNNQLASRLTTDAPYSRVTLRNNHLFSNDTMPFALADLFPLKPTVDGPTSVCSGSNNILFTGESNTDFFEWEIPTGVEIASGATNDSIRLNFNNTGGVIRSISTSASGKCKEISDSLIVIINPSPVAGFTADTNDVFTRYNIQFTDTSLGTPVAWRWYFGDGDSSLSPVPKHAYDEVGTYPVILYITDSKGCTDSVSSFIRVLEGIFIPNVFTPNGDGVNDVFWISSSGLEDYHIQIFNRWGNLIFETTATEIIWDGTTPTGKEVQAGTYYYVLKAASTTRDYSRKGYITLLK